ncbi:MAG: hypothetical protein ACYSW7_04195 [Planctomycetota bacterium]
MSYYLLSQKVGLISISAPSPTVSFMRIANHLYLTDENDLPYITHSEQIMPFDNAVIKLFWAI